MPRLGHSLGAALISSVIAITAPAQALVIVHNDRTSFAAAAGATSTETFNSFASEVPFHTAPLDVGDFTLSMTGVPSSDPGRNSIDLPPALFPQFNVDGTTIANVLTGSGQSLFYTFDAAITAFGADFGDLNDGGIRTQVWVNGQSFEPQQDPGSPRFWGFVSDSPFTTVEFRGLIGDGYGVDNVTYSGLSAAPVPEPTTWAMMIMGFGIIGAAVRSRRSRKPVAASV